MKLLILGGSKAQLPGIIMAKKMGHTVIVCDYLKNAIGHNFADSSFYVSTFDLEGVLKVAVSEKIDGIMTLGTDQPVLIVAQIAKILSLPSILSVDIALAVTNKIIMKSRFVNSKIPTVPYVLYEKGVKEECLTKIKYPVVIKPVDSQGQRGIFYLENKEEVMKHYDKVIIHSRDKRILVEEYYANDEITISGWVEDGEISILSVTDRVTFNTKDEIGICLAHTLPSKYILEYKNKIETLTYNIVKAFEIENGPIYFQYFIGEEGLKVNEIACRIGGAYEATFLPLVTGFDICKALIEYTLGEKNTQKPLEYLEAFAPSANASVQLFFATKCKVAEIPDNNEILEIEGVVDYDINYKIGDEIANIKNATSRAGYVILKSSNMNELKIRLELLYEKLKIIGEDGYDHIIHEPL